MNERIAISVLISFAIVFSSLLLVNNAFSDPEKKDHPFFSQPDSNNKKVLILGSSHVGLLNTTFIAQSVFEKNPDYEVINLAYNGDKPKKRTEILQQMISLEPDFVLYGISYRDFGYSQHEDQFVPERSLLIEKMLQIQNMNAEINPKLITLKAIHSIFTNPDSNTNQDEQVEDSNEIVHTIAPFYPNQRHYRDLASMTELKRDGNIIIASQIFITPKNNEQTENFKIIINEFQKNNINVVLFTVPLHKLYFNAITPETKFSFEQILEDVKGEFDVKIYDLREKYIDFPYWYNVDHIAHIPEVMGYSTEIASIINLEIDS